MTAMLYENLVWPDVRELLQKHWLIMPVGAIEQHGPHLPLGVDKLLAQRISWDVAQVLDAIVAPVIGYGARSLPNSGGGPSYPGTIYLHGNVLINVYYEIICKYIVAGATKILLLNGHSENEAFFIEAVEKCRENGFLENVTLLALSWWNVIEEKEMTEIFGEFPGWHMEHAGQAETALMLHYTPELVHTDKLVDHQSPIPSGIYQYPTPSSWVGNDGVLSKTTHVAPAMGKQLATLVKTKILSLVGDDT